METLVLDASVLLKVPLVEEDSPKAHKIMNKKDNFELSILVPDIFRYEFLQKMTREAGKEGANQAYYEITERQVSIIPLAQDIISGIQKIMDHHPKVAFYDAAYHALAKAYRVDLITADEAYYEKTKALGNIKLLKDFKI
jgi:predicted nucleic acid-binding protein